MAVALVMAMTIPAMAEPNLTIKGQYQVFGMHADGTVAQNSGLPETADDDEKDFVYQRFRVAPKFKASDNVSAHLRFDFAEGNWGQDQNFTTARASNEGFSDIQVDRAYVDVDTQWLRVRAGLQFVPVGQTQVFRDNQPALQFNIKTGIPLDIRLGWVKASEGIGVGSSWDRLSDEEDEMKDVDRYLAQVGWKADTWSASVFGVMQTDGGTGDTDGDGVIDNFEDEPNVFGLRFKMNFGALGIHGELAQFGGDNGEEVDYTGTQFNVNGMFNFTDSFKLGLDLIYSSAQGDDEQKITYMGNPFASYDIRFGGSMGWDTQTWGRTNAPIFATFPPGGPLPGDVFDPFETGAGAIGAGLGAMWTPLDWMYLIGQFHYLTADDDDLAGVDGEFESGYNLLLTIGFHVAPKTTLIANYQRVDADFMDDYNPDASNVYGLGLDVKF